MTTRSLIFLRPSAAVGLAMLAVGVVMTLFDSDLFIGRVFMFAGAIDLIAAFAFGRFRHRES